MRENVFDALGMTRTTFRQDEVLQDGDFAMDGTGPTDDDNPWMRPGVGAWSSVLDLARFAEFLLHGNEAVLSQELLDEALSPQVQLAGAYRMHWGFIDAVADVLPIWSGDPRTSLFPYDFRAVGGWVSSWFGGSSMLTIIPSNDFAIMYLGTRGNELPLPGSVLMATTSILDLPELAPIAPGDDRDSVTYVGTYATDAGSTAIVSLRDDGGLRLSSPGCDLEELYPQCFWCPAVARWVNFRLNEDGTVRDMELQAYWVATPVE